MTYTYNLPTFLNKVVIRITRSLFYTTLFISAIGNYGCKKFVTVGAPKTQLVATSVFSNSSTATSAMTVVYSNMVNESQLPYYIPLFTGMSADELTNYSTLQDWSSFYTNSLTPSNGAITNIWTPAYSYIYQSNAVIEGLQKASTIPEAVKNQLTGEALFIRAFWHFYLVNLFGEVPLVTSTNYSTNSGLARSKSDLIYQQIILDLQKAQSLLSADFVDATDTTITSERIRPTKWAAASFLARVYLYSGNWKGADSAASAVIANTSQFQLDSLNNIFLKNSKEAIWELQPAPGSPTPEGYNFILTGAPSSGSGAQTTTLSPQLLNAFEPNDYRLIAWVTSISDNGNTYYFPYKYKDNSGSTEYSVVLRLGEQYLIRAEARTQLGDLSGAQSDLNEIRHRARLPDAIFNNKDLLLNAILHERQVELFTEWGHRWLDLKRTNNIDAVMSNVSPLKGGTWNSYKALYPIPQTERSNDPNLSQNLGY